MTPHNRMFHTTHKKTNKNKANRSQDRLNLTKRNKTNQNPQRCFKFNPVKNTESDKKIKYYKRNKSASLEEKKQTQLYQTHSSRQKVKRSLLNSLPAKNFTYYKQTKKKNITLHHSLNPNSNIFRKDFSCNTCFIPYDARNQFSPHLICCSFCLLTSCIVIVVYRLFNLKTTHKRRFSENHVNTRGNHTKIELA